MIVCTNCGHDNADDAEFCESCQGFLEWSGEKVVAPHDPEPVPSLVPEPGAGGVGSDAAARPEPVDDRPQAIRPGQEHLPPPRRRPEPVVEADPGQLICDQCGHGNRAEANFCRRCGASLEGARVAQRPPWWRRMRVRRKRTYAAGERRRSGRAQATTGIARGRSGLFQATRLLAVLSLLGIVSFGAWRGDVLQRARDGTRHGRAYLFPRYDPVLPTSFRATSSLPGHGAGSAFDNVRTSFWAEGVRGDGSGEKLVARFDRLVDVARVGIHVGDQAKPQNFANQPVPHRLRINFFDRNGKKVASKLLFLAQKPDFQRFSVGADDVTRVVATILTVFHSPRGHSAAITEITFFEKH